jgi:hypothetical protein
MSCPCCQVYGPTRLPERSARDVGASIKAAMDGIDKVKLKKQIDEALARVKRAGGP